MTLIVIAAFLIIIYLQHQYTAKTKIAKELEYDIEYKDIMWHRENVLIVDFEEIE